MISLRSQQMHCFICVTYMIILTSANPTTTRELSNHKQRSLFRDVIESLRLHAQLPGITNQNEDNNLSHNYDRFEYENEADLKTDTDYLPRRNDRLEMPGLKHRLAKELKEDETRPNKEIVVYINTELPIKKSTEKPKPTTANAKKPTNDIYVTNKMAGQSQIGDRKTETVIKPVVIVNIKGFPDTKISKDSDSVNITDTDPIKNYFNIKQEINLGRGKIEPKANKEENTADENSNTENIMMCDASFDGKEIEKRKFNGVLEILFSI